MVKYRHSKRRDGAGQLGHPGKLYYFKTLGHCEIYILSLGGEGCIHRRGTAWDNRSLARREGVPPGVSPFGGTRGDSLRAARRMGGRIIRRGPLGRLPQLIKQQPADQGRNVNTPLLGVIGKHPLLARRNLNGQDAVAELFVLAHSSTHTHSLTHTNGICQVITPTADRGGYIT